MTPKLKAPLGPNPQVRMRFNYGDSPDERWVPVEEFCRYLEHSYGLVTAAGRKVPLPRAAEADEFFSTYPVAWRGSRGEFQVAWRFACHDGEIPDSPLDELLVWIDSWLDMPKDWRKKYIPTAAHFLERNYWARSKPEPDDDGISMKYKVR